MRERAIEILEEIRANDMVSDYDMLDYIICNYLSGSQAEEIMESIIEENELECYFGEEEEEEWEEEEEEEEEEWELLGYFIHKDDVGTELDGVKVMVVIDDYSERLTCYSPIGQHSEMDREYFDECVRITKEEYVNASSCFTPPAYLK